MRQLHRLVQKTSQTRSPRTHELLRDTVRELRSAMDSGDVEKGDAEEEDDESWQELRLVPEVAEGQSAADAMLGAIYTALCECAALNPDEDDGVEDADDGGDDAFFDPSNPESMLASATAEQLSMLDRYDAMLDGSAGADGRFDDADEAADNDAQGGGLQ